MQEIVRVEKLEIDVGKTGHITNCYFVIDNSGMLVIIDPADDLDKIIQKINAEKLRLTSVIITHCHSDHIMALSGIMKEYPMTKVYMHQDDIVGLNDASINCEKIVGIQVPVIDSTKVIALRDKQVLQLGKMHFEVAHTPGHTKGSIVLFEKTSKSLFTGDTILSNTYGRTDLKTGSHDSMRMSLDKIFNNWDSVMCFAGHGTEFILSDVKRKINLLFAYKG